MFVAPFWSYRPAGSLCVVKNWLTCQEEAVPARILDLLEHFYTDSPLAAADGDCGLLATAERLRLVFEGIEPAEAWLSELERGWLRAEPTIDQIELTNRCPYSCRMCPRTTSMDRGLGDMPLDLFEKIISQVASRQSYVGLHHFGESLLHPGLPEAVALARRHGLDSGLSCNPPSLHPRLAARLLEAGLANLVLSLDSLDADSYRAIRGRVALINRADDNLRELVRARDAGAHRAFLTLQMISMIANKTEAERFLNYCRDIGVDRGVVVRLGRWDFDDEYLTQLGEFTTPGYTGYCSRPWESVVVLWDGRVVPCCHDYNGAVVMGDLRTQTLEEVWRSPAAIRFRTANRDYELCRRCAFSRWYREEQRHRQGFRHFHREHTGARMEWINPASQARIDGRSLFDGFDVLNAGIGLEA
jgi:radical SAM protein with 4Fe4S-binding SPASM domain